MLFQETAGGGNRTLGPASAWACIKVTRIIMTFQYFSSAHTVDPNTSDNAAKVTRIIMIFQRVFFAHTADLDNSDNAYNIFLVSFLR